MKRFILETFNSKNTFFEREIFARDEASAENKARKISEKMFFPVIISGSGFFVRFEQGKKVAYNI